MGLGHYRGGTMTTWGMVSLRPQKSSGNPGPGFDDFLFCESKRRTTTVFLVTVRRRIVDRDELVR